MNKHILHGLIVGGLFAVMITWVAAFDAIAEGGLALLASAVFGLAAGLCIGGDRGELCHAGGRGKGRAGGGRTPAHPRSRQQPTTSGSAI